MIQRCNACAGSGKILGGGMMIHDCYTCRGRGEVDIEDDEIDYLLKKETDHYKNAKEKIKNLSSDMTDEEAEKILDAELDKNQSKNKKNKKEIV